MNPIGEYVKRRRREAGLTQEEFALRSGLGLRFVRELEQGKETVRMDKVNQALSMFGMEAVPGKKNREEDNFLSADLPDELSDENSTKTRSRWNIALFFGIYAKRPLQHSLVSHQYQGVLQRTFRYTSV